MGRTSDARERLLHAAIDLIWSNSYGSVGVDLICEKADVRKGSFYHFFPSKVDLAIAAYEEHWRQKRGDFDRVFSPLTPPLERLTTWCAKVYEDQRSLFERLGHVPGCPFANLGCELSTQDERIRAKTQELLERGLRYLESAIADAQRDGLIGDGDPKALAKSAACCAMGMVLQAKMQNDPELLRNLEPMVLRQLGAAEVAA
jgi:TetR/AcrR family transcriptional repressor of nem operon